MAINFLKRKDEDENIDDIMSIDDIETGIWGDDEDVIEAIDDENVAADNTFGGINEAAVTLKLVTPKSLSETEKIADYLIAGSSVVLNIEEIGEDDVVRFMDYLQGVLHVIRGNMKQVSKTTFVATPNNVGIDSDVSAE